MSRRKADDDDAERAGDDQDRDLPDESDMDSTDEEGLDACPFCRKMIFEDAERCPHCGQYLSDQDRLSRGPSMWVVWVIVGLLIAAVLGWMFR